MDTTRFLLHRVAFMGVPFGELQQIICATQSGEPWIEACLGCAAKLRQLAQSAEASGRRLSAAEAWRWVACAYHAASFDLHLNPDRGDQTDHILELRRLARDAYLKALRAHPALATPVEVAADGAIISGYLRLAAGEEAPVVVLLNGLDSMCEVEMHTFSDWLLSRGLSTLSLDLPASYAAQPRAPKFDVEKIASPLADWIYQRSEFNRPHLGAFGVSFGGHLAARMLAGDARFAAGVAVSPPAWIGPRELDLKRVRLMLAWAFDLRDEAEVYNLAAGIRLDTLPGPTGRLLIFEMEQDRLFGRDHIKAFSEWGRDRAEVRSLCAEHVGTSVFQYWLPEACDWLSHNLKEKGERLCSRVQAC